jgi:cell division septation protein DedD
VVDVTGLGPAPGEESPLPQPDVTADPDVEAPAAEEEPNTTPTSAPEQRPLPVEGGRYIVQVASFGAADNANRLSARLQEAGYSVMTDTVKSDVGTLHRVRVGPFESEARARETVLALSSSIDGVRPRVMDLQPERSAQVTTPEDPLVRWVVQVGSFASSENAENVVASLRLKGMSAYRESVSSGNSEIFRVRVGPFLSREDAIAAEREINESLSVSAVVMSIR